MLINPIIQTPVSQSVNRQTIIPIRLDLCRCQQMSTAFSCMCYGCYINSVRTSSPANNVHRHSFHTYRKPRWQSHLSGDGSGDEKKKKRK